MKRKRAYKAKTLKLTDNHLKRARKGLRSLSMKRKPGRTSGHNARAQKTHKRNLWTTGRGGIRL